MTPALILLGLAALLMSLGRRWMVNADWPRHAPRLAIAVWQVLSASVIASLVLACFALAIPGLSAASTVGEVVRLCLIELGSRYTTAAGAVWTSLSLAAGASLVGLVAAGLCRQWRLTSRARADHLDRLALISEPLDNGIFVVDHPAPLVYCVPGRRRRTAGLVVMTRAVREVLTDRQIASVLHHEHAHLRSGHAQLIERSRALAQALPWLPFFTVAHQQVSQLAEMHADDAVTSTERLTLAAALYRLSVANRGMSTPPGTLAATQTSAVLRAKRLVQPRRKLGNTRAAGIIISIAAMVALPTTLAFVPGGPGVSHNCCNYTLTQVATPVIR